MAHPRCRAGRAEANSRDEFALTLGTRRVDGGPSGVHRALLLRGWSDDVTLLTDGSPELSAEDARRLDAAGVVIDERRVEGLRGEGRAHRAAEFAGGTEMTLTQPRRDFTDEQVAATIAGYNGFFDDMEKVLVAQTR